MVKLELTQKEVEILELLVSIEISEHSDEIFKKLWYSRQDLKNLKDKLIEK